MAKKISGFNFDKAIGKISKPSVFDRIVKEIDAKEIPAKYIESIIIQYQDGTTVELNGKELTHPVPLHHHVSWDKIIESFKKMRDVKVYILTEKLENDVDNMVEDLLGKYC